jgi:hypothetical protein
VSLLIISFLSSRCAVSVLNEIHDAVKKRIPADAQALCKGDRISAWIKNRATDVKRIYKDADELQEHRRKLTNVVEEFKVRERGITLT